MLYHVALALHHIVNQALPGNHFVALGGGGGGGGGGGRKLGALMQNSIEHPPFFFAELRCKKGGRIIEQVQYIPAMVYKDQCANKVYMKRLSLEDLGPYIKGDYLLYLEWMWLCHLSPCRLHYDLAGGHHVQHCCVCMRTG